MGLTGSPGKHAGGKIPIIASLYIFSLWGSGLLSDDKCLALCCLCHGHACQWSKHSIVYSYCGATRSFSENFVLALSCQPWNKCNFTTPAGEHIAYWQLKEVNSHLWILILNSIDTVTSDPTHFTMNWNEIFSKKMVKLLYDELLLHCWEKSCQTM